MFFGRKGEELRDLLIKSIANQEAIQKDVQETKETVKEMGNLWHAHLGDKTLHLCDTHSSDLRSAFDRIRDNEKKIQANDHAILTIRRVLWGIVSTVTPFVIWFLNYTLK